MEARAARCISVEEAGLEARVARWVSVQEAGLEARAGRWVSVEEAGLEARVTAEEVGLVQFRSEERRALVPPQDLC